MSGGRWSLWLRRLGKNFLYSVPVTVAFLDSVGYVAKVEGISMQPSLNPEDQKTNDYVLLNKWAIRNFKVQHGDIVALTCPRDPDQKLIKRVIAVEGETIRCSDRRRYVSIPVGHCWVEGDHVTHSMDSNYFGPVSTGLIFAKASHIVWPPSRWQKLDSETTQLDRRPIPCPQRSWETD
ncbi:mitochondrial inner membrane protease subunit 2-like [Argiope bruennichi]|nr:mitochondrial inner membrane protease subunit 2-like [Argiope bruennichi]